MKAVIPEALISMYDLTVPYALDVQKIRKKLDGELEKLHPCFPERYAADYHVRFHPYRTNGHGIHIRAIVMDRLQLADFRKQNANCLLYAGGRHLYPVFSGRILKRRLCLVGAALFAVITILSAMRYFRPKAESVPVNMSAGMVVADHVAESLAGAETASALTDFSPFMNCVYGHGGSVSALSWNAGNGVLSLQISGLYPEQLSGMMLSEAGMEAAAGQVSFGTVTYRDGLPEMQLTLTASLPEMQMMPSVQQERHDMLSSCLPAVRTLILERGGILASETVDPPSLSGNIPLAEWASFSSSLLVLLGAGTAESKTVVRLLDLTRSGGVVELSLSFADETPSNCLPFSDLASVFLDAPGLPYAPPEEDDWSVALSQQREIGRITREDGSAVVFFHNKEGKIERRVYE